MPALPTSTKEKGDIKPLVDLKAFSNDMEQLAIDDRAYNQAEAEEYDEINALLKEFNIE